jgi:DNA mismatch repair protein MutS2
MSRRALEEAASTLGTREREVKEREERLARRINEKLDDRVRQARRDIEQVIEELKNKSEALVEQASTRARGAVISTGETGAARAEAREALDTIVDRLKEPAAASASAPPIPATVGARVSVGAFGMEGTILAIHGSQAEIDVRGKKLRAPLAGVRVISASSKSAAPAPAKVRVNVDLTPREGLLSELNVIGATVDQAIDRVARFLHGLGTGQLRRGIAAYLKDHPLVAKFYAAPREQGGEGATIVELKE